MVISNCELALGRGDTAAATAMLSQVHLYFHYGGGSIVSIYNYNKAEWRIFI